MFFFFCRENRSDKSEAVNDPPKPKITQPEPAKGKAGGIYIPPFKLAKMMKAMSDDKSSPEYQRLTWDALRKSINGLVNKVNVSNIKVGARRIVESSV